MASYTSFVIVAAIAFAAPMIRGMAPQILVPSIVLELVAGEVEAAGETPELGVGLTSD